MGSCVLHDKCNIQYYINLCSCYNHLISVCVPKKENGYMDVTFVFITQKDKSMMVKCKLHSEQKQLHLHFWSLQAPAQAEC